MEGEAKQTYQARGRKVCCGLCLISKKGKDWAWEIVKRGKGVLGNSQSDASFPALDRATWSLGCETLVCRLHPTVHDQFDS